VIAFERERGLGQVVDQLYAEVIPLIDDLKRVARRADTLLAGLPATQQKLDTALTSATSWNWTRGGARSRARPRR